MERPRQVNILLADGHDIVRRGVRDLLSSHPEWQVCGEARNGRDAITLATRFKPDVLVIAIDLPELDGIETARWIKRMIPETEILFYTSHDEEYLIARALQMGARGYVLKADPDEKLIEAIGALVLHVPFFTAKAAEMLLKDLRKTSLKEPEPQLTSREREIMTMIAQGISNKEIASHLKISPKTVEAHRSAIMRKLGLQSITELVRYAIRNKLIEP